MNKRGTDQVKVPRRVLLSSFQQSSARRALCHCPHKQAVMGTHAGCQAARAGGDQRVDLVALCLFEDCSGVLDACEVNLALMDEGHEAPR